MAGKREASIKVTVDGGAFRTGMRELGDVTETAASKMKKSLKSAAKDGFGAAKNAAKDLVGSMKSTISMAATLGGALSIGAGVKSAIDSQQAYIALANQLRITTGQAVTQADAQGIVERAVDRSKGSIEEAQRALQLLGGVGDLALVEDVLGRAQLQAKRLGVDIDRVAESSSVILAKGMAKTGEEVELMVEEFNRFSRVVLGVNPEDALNPTDIAEFATFMKSTGADANVLMNILRRTGDAAKDFGQAGELFEELGLSLNQGAALEKIRKDAGLSAKDINLANGSIENLFRIIETGSPRALKALLDNLAGDRAGAAIQQLLGKELFIKIEAGKATKEEIAAIGENFRAEMTKTADRTKQIADIQATNAALTASSGAKLQDAINKVEKAFSSPRVVESIDKLADKLPELAEGITKLISFVVDKPGTAAAGLVLGRVALAFAGGAVEAAAAKGMAAMMAKLVATQAASSLVGAGGSAAVGLGGAVVAGGAAAAATVAAAAVVAGAGGFLVGTLISEAVIEPALEKKVTGIGEGSVDEALTQAFAARQGGTVEDQRAAVERIRSQKKSVDNSSLFIDAVGNIAAVFSKATGDQGVKTPEELRIEQIARLQAEEDALMKSIKERSVAEKALGFAAKRTAGDLAKVGKAASTTRGPDEPPAATPGAGTTAPGT